MTISTSTIKSVAHAVDYYLGNDHYYSRHQSAEAAAQSGWFGKGADALGLSGPIESQCFEKLLTGELPNGEKLGILKNGTWQHRPGFDITFNVPKSVSLLVHFTRDETIKSAVQQAMDKAVTETLTTIEARYAGARQTVAGQTGFVKTGNLVIARFKHNLSRAGDPHEHIHAVVMNMTQRPDGVWRSLASDRQAYATTGVNLSTDFLSCVRVDRPYFNMQFWSTLAYELEQLGFTVGRTHARGSFEIVGISRASIELFSTRSKAIAHYMRQHGLSGAAGAAMATQYSRGKKIKWDDEALQKRWLTQQQLRGIDVQAEVDQCVQQRDRTKSVTLDNAQAAAIPTAEQQRIATEAVSHSIEALARTEVSLAHLRLVNLALAHTLGKAIAPKWIDRAIQQQIQAGVLIQLPDAHHSTYLTQALLEKEQQFVMLATTVKRPPLLSGNRQQTAEAITQQLVEKGLPDLVSQSTLALCHSDAMITLVDGVTTENRLGTMTAITLAAQCLQQECVLLTTTRQGCEQLRRRLPIVPINYQDRFTRCFLGRPTHDTLAHFVNLMAQPILKPVISRNTLFIVEHAQAQPIAALLQLAELANTRGAKVVLLGNQHASAHQQAGAPYHQCIERGAEVITLTEASLGQTEKLARDIAPNVIGIKDNEARWVQLVNHYLAIPAAERHGTLLIAPSRKIQTMLNQRVHEAKLLLGELTESDSAIRQPCDVLIPDAAPNEQFRVARAWKKGQWLHFRRACRGIRQDWWGQIKTIQVASNRLVLVSTSGDIRWLNPQLLTATQQKSVAVYTVAKRNLCLGETLCLTDSDPYGRWHKSERVTLIAQTERQLQVARHSGEVMTLTMKSRPGFPVDYGYVQLASQQTNLTPASQLITCCQSYAKALPQRLYELSHRAKRCVVYTDDKNRLLVNLSLPDQTPTALSTLLAESGHGEPVHQLTGVVARLIEASMQQPLVPPTTQPVSPTVFAEKAVAFALAHLSEREAAFTCQALIETAMTQVFGKVTLKTLESAVQQAERSGELMRGIYWYQNHFTTRLALAQEKAVVNLVKKDQGKLAPLLNAAQIQQHFARHPTFTDHEKVLSQWFASGDRVVLLDGVAGSGKTTLLNNAAKALADAGYTFTLLAPTHSAVKEIRQRGVEAETLARFLVQRPVHTQTAPVALATTVYVVDENTLNGTRVLQQFLTTAHQLNARILAIGDTHQPSGVEAGKDHAILSKFGVMTLRQTRSYRQKPRVYQEAVKSLYAGDFRGALDRLTVIEAPLSEEQRRNKIPPDILLAEKLVECYRGHTQAERDRIIVTTPANHLRCLINQTIQQALFDNATATSKITVSLLAQTLFSQEELKQSQTFKPEHIVQFVKAVNQSGFKAGDYYQVQQVDTKRNRITLKDAAGQLAIYQPDGENVQLYHRIERTIHVGERLVMTKNRGETNNSTLFYTVIAIADHALTLQPLQQMDQGLIDHGSPKTVDLSLMANQHLELGYCLTLFRAQGLQNRITLTAMPAEHPFLTHQKNVLEALTRGVDKAILVTDNQAALLKTLEKQTGDKTSALEAIGDKHLVKPPDNVTTTSTTRRPPAKLFTAHSQTQRPQWDGRAILSALADYAETVARRLLGEPKKVLPNALRYGKNKGSLIVTLQGAGRGLWYDHSTGEGGNLLQLIADQQGLSLPTDYRQALEAACQLLGRSPDRMLPSHATSTTLKSKTMQEHYDTHRPSTWSEAEKRRIRFARQLANQSQPIQGTLAERYLREHRGIDLPQWPKDLRFHKGIQSGQTHQPLPALLGIYRNDRGNIRAVQAIYLDSDTAKKIDPVTQSHLATLNKQTFGVIKQGACTLKQRSPYPLEKSYLAEGIETGLSVLCAQPKATVHVSLGLAGFKNIAPTLLKHNVVICLDNDGKAMSTNRSITLAVERFIQADKQVSLIMPTIKGDDYNDLLMKAGLQAVQKNLQEETVVNSVSDLKTISMHDQIHQEQWLSPDKTLAQEKPAMTSQPMNAPVMEQEKERDIERKR